ncbi:unnamed protein product [Paramecium primaurelia]|uniref:Oxidoreductase n=1 Tax=Paramecium primaurelia TaxID=5886 RepID=A0A8S1NHT1_PARPR|nr:unnamed protein product [Paramecium primaurelia]
MNNKVRIGIMSTAEIAHKVCLAINCSEQAEVYCVASRSLEKARQWADAHNIKIAYGTYDELLDDPNVDGVYIPLPTSLKKEWAIKAANKKKHVLVEKPLPGADSSQCLEEMIKCCEDNGVQFLDGTMWLHSLRTQIVKQKKQELGKISKVIAAFTFKAPNEEWLHGGNGRTNKNQEPQGCLGDQGWYPVGAILFAFDYELPQFVQCLQYKLNKVDTIIEYSGFIEFSNQRYAYFDCGVTSPHRSFVDIVCENGQIRIDDLVGGFGRTGNFNAYFENFVGSERFFVDDLQGKEEVIKVEGSNHTVKMIDTFANIIKSKKNDHQWHHRSLTTHKVLTALFKATQKVGEKVQILQ